MAQFFIALLFLVAVVSPSLAACPAKCKCKSPQTVNCRRAGLTAIPADIPPTATSIDLSFNSITTVPDNAFAKAPKLLNIDLRNNRIASLTPNSFAGIQFLDSLYLVSNQLDDTTEWASINGQKFLTKLYLSHNLLTKIPPLQTAKLSRLILDGNRIASATIPIEISSCYDLSSIVLSGNLITAVTSTDFKNIASLSIKSIDLKLNSLSQIDPAAILPLAGWLETLNLDHNQLDLEMLRKFFLGLKTAPRLALQTLSIGSNGLSKLDADLFAPLAATKLFNLQLDGNVFTSIDPAAFAPVAKTLTLLNLRSCGLSKLTFDPSSFQQLQDLRLDDNRLTTLPPALPKSLQRFTVARNQITGWAATTFNGVAGLVALDLGANLIRTLTTDAGKPNTLIGLTNSLQHLNLYNNPFNCSCDLAAFIRWANTKPKVVTKFANYTCATPSDQAGKLVKAFDVDKCKTIDVLSAWRANLAKPKVVVIQGIHLTEVVALVAVLAMALVCIVALRALARQPARVAPIHESEKQRLFA